MGLIFVLMKI